MKQIRIAEYPKSVTASSEGGKFKLEERAFTRPYKWLPFIKRYYWTDLRYSDQYAYDTLEEAKKAAQSIINWPKYHYIQ